jgi:HEAT repeat protein
MTMHYLGRMSVIACLLLAAPRPAAAQTRDLTGGMFLPSSLGALVKNSPHIVVLQVERVDRDRSAICFRKAADLKGKDSSGEYRHVVGKASTDLLHDTKAILGWARPGRLAVCFHNGKRGNVCIGNTWYWCEPQKPPEWDVVSLLDQLPLVYVGPVEKLCDHVRDILAGQVVTVTARSPGEDLYPFALVNYPDWPRGKKGRVWRIKASLTIGEFAYSDESPLFVGWGVGGPEVVPALAVALRDPDSLVRADAAQDLGQLGPVARAAAPGLRHTLKDEDPYVRIHAAVALARVEPASVPPVATLVEALRQPHGPVPVAATVALASLGPRGRSAVPALVTAMADGGETIRYAGAVALGELAPEMPRARPGPEIAALVRILEECHTIPARRAAVRALCKYGVEAWAAAPALRQALWDPLPDVARDAADLLARFGAPAVNILAAAVQDPEATDRAWAADRLREIGPRARAAIPTLMGALKEEKTDLRLDAARALLFVDPALGRKAAMPVLLAMLKEQSIGLRANVLFVLEEAGPDKRAVPALCPLIANTPNDGVGDMAHRWHAEGILGKIGPDAVEAVPVLRAALGHGDCFMRYEAAVALWRIGRHREGIPVLVRDVKDRRNGWRWRAARALGRIGPGAREALPALREALQRKGEPAPHQLALALWRVAQPQGGAAGSPADRREAVAQLIAMIPERGDPPPVRWGVLEALTEIGPEARAAVPLLVTLLRDEDVNTRQPAVAALGVLAREATEATAPMCWALDDRAMDVRAQAARCLYRLGRRHPRALPVLIQAVQRDPEAVPEDVVRALGPDARALIPPLLRHLRGPARQKYLTAARALQMIDPQAAAKVWGVPATARLPWENLSSRQLEKLWADLSNPDLPRAYRAVWTLALAGEPAVALLGQHLRPAPRAAPEQVARLIDELGSQRFSTRQKATVALERILDAAAPAMRQTLASSPPEEVRRRLERVLEGLEPANTTSRLRALRALEVLEEIGTRRARQVLEGLTGGAPEARLTQEARAAVGRLDSRGVTSH